MAKNIEINYNNGLGYDVLYPYTTLSNITDWSDSIYSKDEVYSKTQMDTMLSSLNTSGLKAEIINWTGTGTNDYSLTFSELTKIYLLALNQGGYKGGMPTPYWNDSFGGGWEATEGILMYFWGSSTNVFDGAFAYMFSSGSANAQIFVYYSGKTINITLKSFVSGAASLAGGTLDYNQSGDSYTALLIGE